MDGQPSDLFGDLDAHFWLTRSVARRMGVNLRRAMDEHRLSPDDYRQMIENCRGCPVVAGCQKWLGQPEEAVSGGTGPDGCLLADALRRLRPH